MLCSVAGLVAVALLYLCLSGSSTDPGPGLSRRDTAKVGTRHKFMNTKRDKLVSCLQAVDWKSVDLLALQLPGDTVEKAGLVTVRQDRLQVLGAEVFTQVTVLLLSDTLYLSPHQTGSPPPGTASTGRVVVLLHGAAFSSQTWLDRVPTVRTLAALGHTVIGQL